MNSKDTLILVTEIRKLNPKLNEGEKGFLGNILCHKKISNKQAMILQRIYEKADLFKNNP